MVVLYTLFRPTDMGVHTRYLDRPTLGRGWHALFGPSHIWQRYLLRVIWGARHGQLCTLFGVPDMGVVKKYCKSHNKTAGVIRFSFRSTVLSLKGYNALDALKTALERDKGPPRRAALGILNPRCNKLNVKF